MKKWKPIDVISLVIVAGCLGLLYLGYDGMIKITLLVAVSVYYGIDLSPFIKLGRNQGKKED